MSGTKRAATGAVELDAFCAAQIRVCVRAITVRWFLLNYRFSLISSSSISSAVVMIFDDAE